MSYVFTFYALLAIGYPYPVAAAVAFTVWLSYVLAGGH